MTVFEWNESHINWFSNFIKDKGDIKASSFGRQHIPGIGRRSVSKQDRHNLMELVVKRGRAVAIIGKPNDNNYCIHVIPEDNTKHYLNCQMLFTDEINNLPQSAYLKKPEYFPLMEWLDCKLEWLEVVNLFKVYMVKGQINDKNLQQDWDKDKRKYLLLTSERLAKMYTLVRISWELYDCTFEGTYSDPEALFLEMLFMNANMRYAESCKILPQPSPQPYKVLKEFVYYQKYGDYSGDYFQESAHRNCLKILKDLTGEVKLLNGKYIYKDLFSETLFASGYFLTEKKCSNEAFNKAQIELGAVGAKMLEYQLSVGNRVRNQGSQTNQRS